MNTQHSRRVSLRALFAPKLVAGLIALSTLAIGGGTAMAQAQAPDLPPGSKVHLTVEGTLDGKCSRLGDGFYYRVYRLQVVPGRVYVFGLTSRDFDAFLWIQPEGPISVRNALAYNDDAPGQGTDSMIAFQFDRAGTVLVVANSLRGGEMGRYGLAVMSVPLESTQRPGMTPPPPPPAR